MRKKLLFTLWLFVPVLLLAYHYGPGQRDLAREAVSRKVAEARGLFAAEDYAGAMDAYDAAIALAPSEDPSATDMLKLARAEARMYSGELPEAMQDMDGLLTTMQEQAADESQIRRVRGALATAQYYAGWLMRLEGAPAEEWTLEVEAARQHFRLLAEETATTDASVSEDHSKNLEAVIRLARMDLSQLEGLPLPKACQGCKNCSGKCRSQRESKKKGEGKKEGEPEKKDARGAHFNQRPKGGS